LDPILHRITPKTMAISPAGKFSAKYYWKQIQSTQAQVDGKERPPAATTRSATARRTGSQRSAS
jgi:hypothetical protein